MQPLSTAETIPVESTSAEQPAVFAYDRVPYPSAPFVQTHPSRLATLAALHGIRPAPPTRCRVLELGCSDGGNLIPMAHQLPESEFLGIDLSAPEVETGRRSIAELGLRNIELRALDIAAITPELGRFDYIVAHGVYSWVPDAVRAKILSVFRANLAPNGIAFVSYNCHPGSYMRDMTRAMMLYHVRDTTDPEKRVQQAKLLLQTLAEATSDREIYGHVVRAQQERVHKTNDTVLYHDDLDPSSRAFFLNEIVEDASRHGLQYLADATAPLITGELLELQSEPQVAALLRQIPETDWVTREQYLDFIKGRMFRETLFCHHEVHLERPVPVDRVREFQIASDIVPGAPDLDPREHGPAEFKTRAGHRINIDHRLTKAALLHLNAVWPNSIGFADLVSAARARLGDDAEPQSSAEDIEALTSILMRSFCAGVVEIEAFPTVHMATAGEKPEASLLARKQLDKGVLLTSLRHHNVLLDDPVTRKLLVLLDGTRTVDQLVSDLSEAMAAGAKDNASNAPAPVISRENILRNLRLLARLSLLTG